MFSLAHDDEPPPKRLNNHCKFLPCLAPRRQIKLHCRSLPAIISQACVRCFTTFISSLSPEEESDPRDSLDSNIDNKHIIILEIRNRARNVKPMPEEHRDPFAAESFCWVQSPTSGKLLIAPKGTRDGEDEETETFYSVKSFLSRYSSDSGGSFMELCKQSIWDEFRHCEGWPFGLCRRAVILPPLPSSPSDSWTWRKRTPAAKVCNGYMNVKL